jgi:hypothetical protein
MCNDRPVIAHVNRSPLAKAKTSESHSSRDHPLGAHPWHGFVLLFLVSKYAPTVTVCHVLQHKLQPTLTSHSGASFLHMSVIWRCTLGRTLVKPRPNSR